MLYKIVAEHDLSDYVENIDVKWNCTETQAIEKAASTIIYCDDVCCECVIVYVLNCQN